MFKCEERKSKESRYVARVTLKHPLLECYAVSLIEMSSKYWAAMGISSHKQSVRARTNLCSESTKLGRGGDKAKEIENATTLQARIKA